MKDPKENIIKLQNSAPTKNNENLQGILANIYSAFAKGIKPKINNCFEALDDSLFNLAEKSDTNAKQANYFDSMKHIRKSRTIILKDFFNSIQSTFASFKKNELEYVFNDNDKTSSKKDKENKKDLHSISLSLLDDNELDEALAVSNLISKSEMAYQHHIFAFKKRFSVLASKSDIESNQIPIGPFVIVNAFNQCLIKVDLDVNIKLIFYKMFERTVIGQLNDTFNQVNNLFISKGVMPKISYNLTNKANNFQPPNINTPKEKVQETDSENFQNESSQDDQKIQDENYQLISEIFSQNYNNGNDFPKKNTSNNNPIESNIDLNSVLNALSILQGQVFNNNDDTSNESNQTPIEMKDSIINQLRKLDENTTNQKVKRSDEDTINLVGMLFQFIIEDRNLPESIQILLAKLQIPYLKIALQNNNLFADKTHPARVLLNNLSKASAGWSKESDTKMQFYLKLEEITHKILEADKYENNFFNNLNTDFLIFQSKRRKISDIRQKRTTEKNIGQEKIDLAKEASAKLLLKEMSGKEMPLLIKDILLGEWSNVLNLTHLKYNIKSNEYEERVAFIKQVIQLSNQDTEKEVTVNDLFKVANMYGSGLKFIAYNPVDIRAKQRNLVKCLSSINQLNKKTTDEKIELLTPNEVLNVSEIKKYKNEVVNYIEDMITPEAETKTENVEKINEESLEIVKSLKTGMWLEIERPDKTPMRAKLSWISPITGKYLFVNSRGLKITDKKLMNLALGLQNKTIRILQQEELFDRALTSIAKKLKTKN